MSKFALCSKVEANQVPAQLEKLEVDQRAMFRLAYHKFVQAKVTQFRSDYAIPVDRLILLIRGLGIRYQKKKAKKAESDEKVDLPTKQIKPVKTPTSKPAPVVHSDDVLDDYDVSDEEQFDNSRPIEVVNSSDESDEEGLSDEETLRPVQVVNSSDESDVEEEDVDDEEGEDENVEDEGGEDEDGEDNDGEDEESEDEDEEDGVDEENEDVEVSEPPQKTEAGDKSVLVISKGKNDSEKKPMEGKMPSSSTTEPNGLAKSKLKERTRLKVQWPTSNEVAIDKKDGDCRVKKLNLKLLETAEIVFESDDTKVNKVPAFQPEVPRDSFFLGGIDPSSESEGEGDRRDRAQDWAQDRGRAKNAPTWKQRQSGYRSNEWDEKPHHQKPRQERPRQERPRQEKPRPDTRVDKLANKFANRTPLGPERSFGGPPAKATKGEPSFVTPQEFFNGVVATDN